MIRITHGDIFQSEARALVNPVNTVGVDCVGLALAFRKRFPENSRLYREVCANRRLMPGQIFATEAQLCGQSVRIVNLPTKRHWNDDYRLCDIADGLAALKRYLLTERIRTVAIPALGAELDGLSWFPVYKAIENEMSDTKMITAFVYLPR